jgi:SulP family sulfate permease
LFAATILTGIIQFLMGVFRLGKLMNFVPHSVIIGFINALAILIFMAQLPNFIGQSWSMYAMVAGTLAIIYLFPLLTKAIPSPLVAVVIMTLVTLGFGLQMGTVGDTATIVPSLPSFLIPDIPWTLDTLLIILPYAVSLAIVGYSETLLTQEIIDDMTRTKTSKNKEIIGQGIANTITGFFGGMAGCALVAESAINVKLGGRGRLSTLVAGVFLLLLVQVMGEVVSLIPMAALVGVMMMICYEIFDWSYLRNIHRVPRTEALIMMITVAATLITHNLAYGVLIGVLISAILFAYKASRIHVTEESGEAEIIYRVHGQLFFVSANDMLDRIDVQPVQNEVKIDLTKARVWDHTARLALDKAVSRLKENGKNVELIHAAPELGHS